MAVTLLLAAHGTRSAAGSATTAALAAAVQAARPGTPVTLGFLDVAAPSVAEALAATPGPVVVVPVLLSAGYHVSTDIPSVVAGREDALVARHLGPDPVVIDVVARRLAEAGGYGQVLLAAVPSSQPAARAEVDTAADLLGRRLGQPVTVLPLGGEPDLPDEPFCVAAYLLAEGGFLDALRAQTGGRAVVAGPIGADPAVIDLIWARYDEVNRGSS